ncbi:hypothetical protein TI39_contig306g00004 [Zymoseptoria brevis]|uniref:Nephrocystin 3-like N-terminal domain-containing protein n=1 Tax=Zymoseptoria brevis TaxID=1047168 RepID=A0A0F4GXS5_9PEZI|nr:hypothetical protein TI39_contig306g00004 [Zymoseptoria brevis]
MLAILKVSNTNAPKSDPVLENIETLQEPMKRYEALLKEFEAKLSSSHGLKKVAKALKWPFEKSEISESLVQLERHKMLFGLAMRAGQLELSKAIRRDLEYVRDYHTNEEFSKIIKWLSPVNFEARYRDIFSKHQEGTGTRILVRYDIYELVKIASSGVMDLLGLQSTSKYLVSLLGQLLTQRGFSQVPEQIKNAYQKFNWKTVHPTLPEYLDMVTSLMTNYKRTYIVIDALDECTEENNVREELLEGLLQLPPIVSVMITSRYVPGIEFYAQKASKLQIRARQSPCAKPTGG